MARSVRRLKRDLMAEFSADLVGRGPDWLLSALLTPAGRCEYFDLAAAHGLKVTALTVRVTVDTRVAKAGDFPAALRASAGDGLLEVR